MRNSLSRNAALISLESLPSQVRLLVGLTFVFTVLQFVSATKNVRLANSDDSLWQQRVSAGMLTQHLITEAQGQGRFYYATPLYQVPWLLYRIESPVGFAAVRAGLYFSAIALFGVWLALATRSASQAILSCLVAVAALHLPPSFYPVLSYPTLAVGLMALLMAMIAQVSYAREGSFITGLASGVCFLVACLFCEMFILYAPFVILQAWRKASSGHRLFLRRSLPIGVAVTGYLAVYAMFAASFKSTYGGTQFSGNISEALLCLWRQSASCVPGFELLTKRTLMGFAGPLWRSPVEVLQLFRDLSLASVALTALQISATAVMLHRVTRESVLSIQGLILTLALVILPNLLVSFTTRYQQTAHQRMYPYVYSYYAYLALVVLGLSCWHRLIASRYGVRWRRTSSCVSVALVALLYLSAQAANNATLGFLATGSTKSMPVEKVPPDDAAGK